MMDLLVDHWMALKMVQMVLLLEEQVKEDLMMTNLMNLEKED